MTNHIYDVTKIVIACEGYKWKLIEMLQFFV